jgi:hypothetical protein
MSHGNTSPLLRPADSAIVSHIDSILGSDTASQIFRIFKAGCRIETLLLVSLAHQFDHSAAGSRYDLQFSAIKKDGTGKVQTPQMKLLHDVRVELGMAGWEFKQLNVWLESKGFELCRRHSCGDDMVPRDQVSKWYEDMRPDQLRRTQLDWDGTHELVDCPGCLSKKCFFPDKTRRAYDQIFDVTEKALIAAGHPAAMPKLSDFKKVA